MMNNDTMIQQPTCTQDGMYCRECDVCGKRTDNQIISPNDHNWVHITENWYYCFACGMENRNGASGDIILEDLTDTYGNGVNYVVGYYSKNDVTFSKYVSLLLADGAPIPPKCWTAFPLTAIPPSSPSPALAVKAPIWNLWSTTIWLWIRTKRTCSTTCPV